MRAGEAKETSGRERQGQMKKIRSTGITGQQGVALIETTVLKMGSIWHPTGGLEAGTDGYIEFRDPTTGEMLNLHLPVQSKATTTPFSSETEARAAYVCAQEDLDYWMKGNKPIILVVSRPTTGEAYWVSIKDYFRDPSLRKSRKVWFDKERDRFDESTLPRLLAVATSNVGGTYLAPRPQPEEVFSNLLRVVRLPTRIFHAYTDCGSGKEVRDRLNETGAHNAQEWSYRGKQIISVDDLSTSPWSRICDPGTVEEFEVEEWTNSLDEDRQNDLIDLLKSMPPDAASAAARPVRRRGTVLSLYCDKGFEAARCPLPEPGEGYEPQGLPGVHEDG